MWKNQSETVDKIIPSLVTATKQFEAIKKKADNPFHKSKYAKLEHIIESINPVLHDNDLAVIQAPFTTDGDSVGIQTALLHSSGEWIADSGLVITARDKSGNVNAQTYGSSLTYARRYALASFFNLIQEDDDGNVASGYTTNRQAPAPVASGITDEQITEISSLLKKLDYADGAIEQKIAECRKLTKVQGELSINKLKEKLGE